MFNRGSLCRATVCLIGVLAMLVPTYTAKAQFNTGTDREIFDTRPANAYFAVTPNTVENWSLDAGCSPGYVIAGRGDNNTPSLANLLPPSTGTRLVKDLNPGSGSSTFGPIGHSYFEVVGQYFLSANDGSGTNGQEFYRVLGGLYPVMTLKKDINPGAAGSNPAGLTHQTPGGQGKIYFSADDGTNGRELWISNMPPDGVPIEYMVADINPAGSSNPEGFGLTLNSSTKPVVFSADNGTNGRELWATYATATDPNPASHTTLLLKDINTTAAGASSNPQYITTVTYNWGNDSKAFFTADDGVNGRELWRTDGTVAGTVMLKDIVAGAGSSNPINLTPATVLTSPSPSALFFTVGNDLWWSKGTAGGADTLKIKSIGATMSNLTVVYNALGTGNTLYFTVGNALWKSDETSGGTVAVKTFTSAPTNLAAAKGVLYFAADDGTGSGVELWKTDGTTTAIVKDIYPGATGSSPTSIVALGGSVSIRFSADDGTNGRELWKSDGTAGGTVLVKDINPGSAGSDPANLTLVDNNKDILLFTADDGEHGRELWESDGYAEPGDSHVGTGYKWDLESLIKSKGDTSKIAVAGTDGNVLSVYAVYDFPVMGGWSGPSESAHQTNHYIELNDGTDRAPLDISYVDCGDGNLTRPRAPLTDGNYHNAVAFGMVAVLDQNPCDTDPIGPGSPSVPFANVPMVYDGHDWIPIDLAHFTSAVPTNPPSGMTLAQAPNNSVNGGPDLPPDLVPATGNPYQSKRYATSRIDVWGDYIRVIWCNREPKITLVATLPRQYKGGFKALHIGNKAGIQSPFRYYFDTLMLNGGLFATSAEMYGACCTSAGCSSVVGNQTACPSGIFTPWKACAETVCCPVPWADTDRDNDVDMDDFAAMQRCLTPSSIPIANDCDCFDRNADGTINVTDVNKFVSCATGSNVALTPEQVSLCDTYP